MLLPHQEGSYGSVHRCDKVHARRKSSLSCCDLCQEVTLQK